MLTSIAHDGGRNSSREACPFNERFAEVASETGYAARGVGEDTSVEPHPGTEAPSMGNWLAAVEEPPEEAVAVRREALEDESELVREHAVWALGRLAR